MPLPALPPPPPIHEWIAASERPAVIQEAPSLQQEPGGVADDTARVEPETTAMTPGDVELKLRVGFNGWGYSPLSLVLSLVGWQELQACVDVGVLSVGDFTLGLGGEAFYTRPWVLEWLTEAFVNLFAGQWGSLDWRSQDYGAAGRASLHYTGARSLDLYGVFLAGPTVYSLRAETVIDGTRLAGSIRSAGIKVGAGGGVSVVADSGLMGGAELRYLVGTRFRESQSVTLTTPDGDEEEIYEMTGAQRPPRGFSWMVFAGWRF